MVITCVDKVFRGCVDSIMDGSPEVDVYDGYGVHASPHRGHRHVRDVQTRSVSHLVDAQTHRHTHRQSQIRTYTDTDKG